MENLIDKRIEKYILNNRVMTLATAYDGQPYCCNIFYSFDPIECRFYFMSSNETRHITEALKNPNVSGTIVNDDISIGRLQGIQFIGKFIRNSNTNNGQSLEIYKKTFPIAHLISTDLWAIEIDYIKMTNNTLGFGKKLFWQRISSQESDSPKQLQPAEIIV